MIYLLIDQLTPQATIVLFFTFNFFSLSFLGLGEGQVHTMAHMHVEAVRLAGVLLSVHCVGSRN